MISEQIRAAREEDFVSVNTSLTETEHARASVASLVSGNKRSEFYARAIVLAANDILSDGDCMTPIFPEVPVPVSFDEAILELEEILSRWKQQPRRGSQQ